MESIFDTALIFNGQAQTVLAYIALWNFRGWLATLFIGFIHLSSFTGTLGNLVSIFETRKERILESYNDSKKKQKGFVAATEVTPEIISFVKKENWKGLGVCLFLNLVITIGLPISFMMGLIG